MLFFVTNIFSQTQQTQPSPDSVQVMPQLEIPEITIVGKKAITLPFARKGEIFHTEIYDVPGPDSTILEKRPEMPFPLGSFYRDQERNDPWRASADGSIGTFASGSAHGQVFYKATDWDFYGLGGFESTQGYVNNSAANEGDLAAGINSLFATDNDFLKTLRFSLGGAYQQETYGMFGISSPDFSRTRKHLTLSGDLGTINKEGTVLDVALLGKFWDISDGYPKADSAVSVVSPELKGSFAMDMSNFRFFADMDFSSFALDYRRTVQSPSAIEFSSGLRWEVFDRWYLQAGAYYGYASGSEGGSSMLLMPSALMRWDIDANRELSFWWKPELKFDSYDSLQTTIPYLDRELALVPRRSPINLGMTFWYNYGAFNFEIRGWYRESSNFREVTDDGMGHLYLAYLDAHEIAAEIDGSFIPMKTIRIYYDGKIEQASTPDNTAQLSYIPVSTAKGRVEIDLPSVPFMVYSSAEFIGLRKFEWTYPLISERSLDAVLLFSPGISTTLVPRFSLSFDIHNALNSAYQLWYRYPAPGRQFNISAKMNVL